MKKLFAILLLIVFLFNVGGYYVVFVALRFHANEQLRARLDANEYSTDELIELRLPVTLPYPIQKQDFQRVDGKFEHQGQFYKMVKQKLENDVLIIICIKDKAEKNLDKTMKDFSKMANDLPSSSKKAENILSKLLKDFESSETENTQVPKGWSRSIAFGFQSYATIDQCYKIASPPPRS